MDNLAPLLMNFLEEHARPHVQDKVSEELTETKGELKTEMPDMIREHITGPESNPLVAQIVSSMGDDFMERVRSITAITIDTASEGMDLLLTNGVMNIAKGVITKKNEENGSSFDMDFLKSGKEGMIETTMAASTPVIKQVSDNMGRKISAHFPAQIGASIQEMIDEHGGPNGMLGMAAGLMAKFMGGGGDGSRDGPGERTVAAGGTESDTEIGHAGAIQQMIQKLLAPKILLLIQPYLQKFEAKMNTSLEGELRNKVFSVDYIKSTVMNMLSGGADGGGHSGFGSILSTFLNRKEGNGRDDRQDGEEKNDDPMKVLANLASGFLKNREN